MGSSLLVPTELKKCFAWASAYGRRIRIIQFVFLLFFFVFFSPSAFIFIVFLYLFIPFSFSFLFLAKSWNANFLVKECVACRFVF